jgi:hypothetical protein
VKDLSHFAIWNFRKGMRKLEEARFCNPGSPVPMDHPPPPRPVEKIIADAHGSSVAIGTTRKNLNTSKTASLLSLKNLLLHKKKEASSYQKELIFCKKTMESGLRLLEDIKRVEKLSLRAVNEYRLATELSE